MQENKLKTSDSYMIDKVQTNLSEFYGSLIALNWTCYANVNIL